MHRRLVCILAVYLLCCVAPPDARGEDGCSAYTSALPAPQHEVQVTDEEREEAHRVALRFEAHTALLEEILKTLRPHLPEHALRFDYYLFVLPYTKAYVDAQILPGGIILIAQEVVEKVPFVDVLAVLLSHEIGHRALDTIVTAEHRRTELFNEYMRLAQQAGAEKDPVLRARLDEQRVMLLTDLVAKNGIEVRIELEADTFAAHIAHRAGYDMHAVADYVELLSRTHGDVSSLYHPKRSERAHIMRCFTQPVVESHEVLREAHQTIRKSMQAP